jgi:hypothetical protein
MGQTVEDIVSERGVSPNTARTQVRGVLEKTGFRRQADAIALLGGIGALWDDRYLRIPSLAGTTGNACFGSNCHVRCSFRERPLPPAGAE